jgi:hypothetical protein
MRIVRIEGGVVVDAIMSSELPDGFIESETANIGDTYDGGVFTSTLVSVSLQDARASQIASITQSCRNAIISGFASIALGAAHTYPSKPEDQTNLIGAVASGLPLIKFWCADESGLWSFAEHTADQIKQVLADAGVQRMGYSAKLAGMVAEIEAATTPGDVLKIDW